jgi:hypothetical protein
MKKETTDEHIFFLFLFLMAILGFLISMPENRIHNMQTRRIILKSQSLGTISGSEGQNTFCPKCRKIAIKREGYDVEFVNFSDGLCKRNGVWN